MNAGVNLFNRKKQKKLKEYAVAKYLYYGLIRFYYYALFFPHFVNFFARHLIHPLIFNKETKFNKRIRSALMWAGGGLIQTCDYKAQRPGIKIILEYLSSYIKPIKKKTKPVVYISSNVSQEFLRAFDAYYIIPEAMAVAGSWMGQDIPHYMLDAYEAEGGSPESCSIEKLAAGGYYCKQNPPPDLIVTSSHPCDSMVIGYTSLQSLAGVPMYVMDAPYGKDEGSYQYYERNLWAMIRFLEKHLNQKINWDKLKASCEELNKANYYFQEITMMSRAIPSPISASNLTMAWVLKLLGSGSPLLTQTAKLMYENAKRKVERGEGWLKEEKIRIIWWDIPIAFINLFPWLEKKFGAVVVGGDLMGRCNTPFVDTSSEECMIRDMARVGLSVGMTRNTRGPSEYWTDEFEQIIAEYSGDCCIFSGNHGCKHLLAMHKMEKDICKRAGLPALFMSSSTSDSRYTSEESLKKQISDFLISNGLA